MVHEINFAVAKTTHACIALLIFMQGVRDGDAYPFS